MKPRVRAADARLVLVVPGTQHRGRGGLVRVARRQTIGRRRTRGDLAARRLDRPGPITRGAFLVARTAARRLGFSPRLLRGRVARARRPRRAVARSLVCLAHPGARRAPRGVGPRETVKTSEEGGRSTEEHLHGMRRSVFLARSGDVIADCSRCACVGLQKIAAARAERAAPPGRMPEEPTLSTSFLEICVLPRKRDVSDGRIESVTVSRSVPRRPANLRPIQRESDTRRRRRSFASGDTRARACRTPPGAPRLCRPAAFGPAVP